MRYNTIVEKDDSGLQMILRAAQQFDEERFLEGIHQRCYTAEDIRQAIDHLRIYQARLNIEARALVSFSDTFLQEFATDNNKCFETAELLFNRIRSTISATRKVFKKTCPIVRRQQTKTLERPSVYVRSVLSRGECNRDLFGLLPFDDSVKTLYEELQAFFTTVITTLGLCRYMIKMERAIREDGDRCVQIYTDCKRKVISGARELAKFIESADKLPESELAARKANARSDEEFCKENYHQWDSGQFRLSVAIDLVQKGRNDGLTTEETRLWPENHAHALRVKKAIAEIDRMPDIANNKGKLKSGFLVELIKWAQVEQENEKAFFYYFAQEYKKSGGKYELPGWNAVSGERKSRRENGISDKENAQSFEKRLSGLPKENDSSAVEDGLFVFPYQAI